MIWPATIVAEREFPAAEVIIDERRMPSKLWLMSSPENGVAQALEFFSGERVADVQVESVDSNFPAERLDYSFAYSFTDRSGHRYASIPGIPYTVGTDRPSIYGGWKDRKGRGHEVVLGDYLSERKTVTGPDGIPNGIDTPIDARPLFGGQSICEATAYVARTQASLRQEAEPGFEPITKIIADHDSEKKCWVTLPALAVDLRDNTILIVIGDKAILLRSKRPVAHRDHGRRPHHRRQGIGVEHARRYERGRTTPNLAVAQAEYNPVQDLDQLIMPKVLSMSEDENLNPAGKDGQ